MDRSTVAAFVEDWISAWNALDLEGVLAHFAEDARFSSPKAQASVGTGTVEGKAALRDYWAGRIAVISDLRFTLDHALWDDVRSELLIVYTATINDQTTRASERFQFGEDGLAVEGEAMYGIALPGYEQTEPAVSP